MARPPPNSWGNEPYSPGHVTLHPQEHPADGLYLPPPSSLVSGTQPSGSSTSGREAVPKTQRYPDSYTVPFPAQRTSSQLPTPTSEPRSPAAVPFLRQASTMSDRLSPVDTPPSSNRPDDLASAPWPHPHPGDSEFSRIPLARPQTQQSRGLQRQQSSWPQGPRDHDRQTVGLASSYQGLDPVTRRPAGYSSSQHLMSSPNTEGRAPPERMRISDLLSSSEPSVSASGKSKAAAVGPTRAAVRSVYKIFVRQQPIAARSCGFGERDRRVIDPPPIVQMVIEDPTASKQDIMNRLSQPHTVMNCTIWNENGDQECSSMPEDYRQQRRLMGTLVSSAFVGKDENNEEGCFFCFPDLSCRTPGKFRLKFRLVIVNPVTGAAPGTQAPVVAKTMSDVFTVYNAKDFPGMQASTPLTKKLKEQGCLISIKKGNERNQSNRNRYDSDDDELGNEDEGIENEPSKPSKRQKRS